MFHGVRTVPVLAEDTLVSNVHSGRTDVYISRVPLLANVAWGVKEVDHIHILSVADGVVVAAPGDTCHYSLYIADATGVCCRRPWGYKKGYKKGGLCNVEFCCYFARLSYAYGC